MKALFLTLIIAAQFVAPPPPPSPTPQRGQAANPANTPAPFKLFAWEQIPTGAEQDSDYMGEYDLLGTSVNVTAALTQSNIQITPIPAKH